MQARHVTQRSLYMRMACAKVASSLRIKLHVIQNAACIPLVFASPVGVRRTIEITQTSTSSVGRAGLRKIVRTNSRTEASIKRRWRSTKNAIEKRTRTKSPVIDDPPIWHASMACVRRTWMRLYIRNAGSASFAANLSLGRSASPRADPLVYQHGSCNNQISRPTARRQPDHPAVQDCDSRGLTGFGGQHGHPG